MIETNGKAEHATRRGVDDARGEHDGKNRPGGESEGADADRNERENGDYAHRARRIDQRPEGNLADQADEPADRQYEADVDLRPFLGRQKYSDERAKSGLDIGDKEDEPVQAPTAPQRKRVGGDLRFELRCRAPSSLPASAIDGAVLSRMAPTPSGLGRRGVRRRGGVVGASEDEAGGRAAEAGGAFAGP